MRSLWGAYEGVSRWLTVGTASYTAVRMRPGVDKSQLHAAGLDLLESALDIQRAQGDRGRVMLLFA